MFRSALSELASLSIPGIRVNYDIDAIPERLQRGQLPVLLVLPVDYTQERRLFQEHSTGFEAIAFSDGVRTVTTLVTHLLLVEPVSSGTGMRQHLPGLIDLIDSYFSTLSTTATLNGELLEPMRVQIEPGIFTYGSVDYHGCAFQHTWVVQI